MISQLPNDQFRTPRDLFDHYNRIYQYTIDGAASEQNTLVPHYWGPGEEISDFFHTYPPDWDNQRVWINPPYSMIGDFLEHWLDVGRGASVTTWLLPSWTDRLWFHRFIWSVGHPMPRTTVDFLPGRVKFLLPDGTRPLGKDGNPSGGKFASIVVSMV